MSRFFSALKQANNSPLTPGEAPGQPLVEDIRFAGVHTPSPSEDVVSSSNGGTTAAAVSAAAVADPWVIFPEHQSKQRRSSPQTGLFTTLARVAVDKNVRMIPNAADQTVVEHYRRLRTKVMQQHSIKPFRSLLVTSAAPQEGKSLSVLNLGLSFAMLPSFRILVVDGDMRRGTLGNWLGVRDQPGFSNLLDGSASLEDVIVTCEDSPIHFITAGTSKRPATELLHSTELKTHFQNMTAQFDLVLVDSPPVTIIADTQLLAAQCEAVLLIARAFKTARKGLEKAAQELLPFRVIGTVLNGGTTTHLYYGYRGPY